MIPPPYIIDNKFNKMSIKTDSFANEPSPSHPISTHSNPESSQDYLNLTKTELIKALEVFDTDNFKQWAENMKLRKQIKDLEDKNILNK